MPKRIFHVVALLLLITACEQNNNSRGKIKQMNDINYKIPENCDFNDIDHTYSSNSCSPKMIKPAYEGVVINVPETIVFNDQMEVLMACTYSFSNKTKLGVFGNVSNAIVFTVIETEGHSPYSGKVPGITNSIPPPPMPSHSGNQNKIDAKDLPLQYQEGYVNLNLLKTPGMPNKVGKYIVYATISTFKSNVVEFEIVNPE